MSDFTEIIYGRVKCAVFHPGFGRALFTKAFQETAGAAIQVIRVKRLYFSDFGEKAGEGVSQGAVLKVVNRLGVPEQKAGLLPQH